ncbi:MAG: hypothetical protein IT178_06055 [Acidobacteria bacterium]|nr:hypothetical protein [Acidobacteriota bacterium]
MIRLPLALLALLFGIPTLTSGIAQAPGTTARLFDASPATGPDADSAIAGDRDVAAQPDAVTRRGVIRSRAVPISWQALAADYLHIDLFDGRSLVADAVDRRMSADGVVIWQGRIGGDALSQVTLVRVGAVLQGSIRSGADTFSIEPDARGGHSLRQVVTPAMGVELPPLVPSPDQLGAPRAADAMPDKGPIEVLVAYTWLAREAAGGSDAALQARIELGVAETNAAYANSGVTQRIRLVGTELVGYAESGDLGADLQAITGVADGEMDIIHARRAALGADLVSLVVGGTDGFACGVAWLMQNVSTAFAPLAFSAVAYPCISPNYTFGHELGHNMGSAHAPDDANFTPAYPFSFGYKDPSRRFRTMMAYDCLTPCPRVLHFSNPEVSYEGSTTGTVDGHDNARSMNLTAATVASFTPRQNLDAVLGAPGNFTMHPHGTSVTFTWTPPPTGIATNYVLEAGTAPGFTDLAVLPTGSAATTFHVANIPAGTYYVRVRALNAWSIGGASTVLQIDMTPQGVCTAPVLAPSLAPAVIGPEGAVRLSWTPAATGGEAEEFVVGAGPSSGVIDTVLHTGSAAPAWQASALPGTYFVRVAGANGCGIGAPSNEIVVVVPTGLPHAPVNLAANSDSHGVVTLTWAAPSSGPTPVGYVVEAGSIGGMSDLALLPSGRPTPGFVVRVRPGTYFVRVRARTVAGLGPPSNEVSVVVPAW